MAFKNWRYTPPSHFLNIFSPAKKPFFCFNRKHRFPICSLHTFFFFSWTIFVFSMKLAVQCVCFQCPPLPFSFSSLWADHSNYAQCVQRTKTYSRNTHPTPPAAVRDHFSWHSNTAAHETGLQLAGTWSWPDFSSLQFKMVSMCLQKPTCAPPHLSEVSPTLPLKWFQCLSWFQAFIELFIVWLTMTLSCPFKEDCLVLPLSMPLSSRWSMVWCPQLCACRFQAPQHFISSKKQATCEGCFALSRAAHHRSFQRWMLTTDTFQFWFHFL